MKFKSWDKKKNTSIATVEFNKEEQETIRKEFNQTFPGKAIKAFTIIRFVDKLDKQELIKKAHQEAHECNALQEVHDWIDWFEKELGGEKNGKKEDN